MENLTQTKWTNDTLKSFNPCPSGYEWYVKNCLEKGIDGTVQVIRLLIDKSNDKNECLQWANWTMARALGRKDRVRYAVFAAEQVIGIFEKKYPDDKRPRKAIEAALAYIESESSQNLESLREARRAYADAYAYAYAAYAAADAYAYADAAYAAAAAAAAYAYAYAYAAYAAADAYAYADAADAYAYAYAAYAAADAYAYADAAYAAAAAAAAADAYAYAYAARLTARREMQIRILEYGITLINDQKSKE